MPGMRLGAAAVAAVALAAPLLAGDYTKEFLHIDGRKHTYFVYAPEGASSPAPLLLLLHGQGRDAGSLLGPWKKLAREQGIVLVAPNSYDANRWESVVDGPAALLQISEAVQARYGTDPHRRYLFGHSAGALFALMMPLWEPDFFAAVAIHAGQLTRNAGPLLKLDRRKTPIHIQSGDRDAFFPIAAVRASRDILAASGFPVEFVEMPKHDHDYYGVAGDVNRRAWEFMKTRRLE